MTQPALSVQLYSVREPLGTDLNGTLAKLSAMGLRQVEAFDFVRQPDALAEAFAANNLVAKTGHAPMLSDQGGDGSPAPSLDTVFGAAKTLGLDIVIDPFVVADRWVDQDEVRATATKLNQAAKAAADHGLVVGYHNHSQEFVADFGAQSAFEWFVDQLDDEVVLEIDLYWAATGKQDVTALLGRLGDRVKALHVKDGIIGENPFRPGAGPVPPDSLDQRPAGQGEVPLLDYLAAAPSTQYAVIEFDHYKGDIFEGVETSVKYFNDNGIS